MAGSDQTEMGGSDHTESATAHAHRGASWNREKGAPDALLEHLLNILIYNSLGFKSDDS